MAQPLDAAAPVVADDTANAGGDSGAEVQNAPADQGKDEQPEDPSAFYADDQPKDPKEGEGEGEQQGDDDVGDDQGDDADQGEGQPEPIEAPASWKDDEKALFAQLPREHQEIIARRETERDKYLRGQARKHQEAEAKIVATAQETLAEIHTRKAQEFQQLAAQFQPQPADARLLYTGRPEDAVVYQQQDAAYRDALAQQQELQHRAQAEIEQAKQVAQTKEQQAAVADLRSLAEDQPDWFEEGTLNLKPDVIGRLEPIGAALNYPPELMAQANSRDLRALDIAHGWKVKADKWDALQKNKMAGVRAAKQLPRIARPGAAKPNGQQQGGDDTAAMMYPDDVRR